MPGPAPDPNALRRDRKDDPSWLVLPNVSAGVVPVWPLPDGCSRELELWEFYWGKPQSVLWLKNQQEHEVAIFVRRVAEVEASGSSTALGVLVQRQMDALLLTIPSMYKARVRIADDEVSAFRSLKDVAGGSIRDRLRVARG